LEKTFLKRRVGFTPEQFIFVTTDASEGSMRNLAGPMSEAEVRAHLSGNGMPDREIDAAIEAARQEV